MVITTITLFIIFKNILVIKVKRGQQRLAGKVYLMTLCMTCITIKTLIFSLVVVACTLYAPCICTYYVHMYIMSKFLSFGSRNLCYGFKAKSQQLLVASVSPFFSHSQILYAAELA